MVTVKVEGWEPGFIAVRFNRFLRDRTELGLADAKHRIDGLLRGEGFELSFDDDEAATAFASEANAMLARCRIED